MRIACGAAFLFCAAAALAAEPLAIDPVGPPAAYGRSVDRATLYVWHSEGEWHVRSRTKEKSRHFEGVIRIEGGVVTGLAPEARGAKVGKKGRVKPRKQNDLGWLSRDRKTINFSFQTAGGEDGFNFKASPPAKAILFDMTVKGFDHPDRILIGRSGANPPAATFRLPAHPGKPADDDKQLAE